MSSYKSITNVLPADCLYEIIQKFDLITLYSCITVDRTFCQLIIPIIWKNPFKLTQDRMKRILIIRTYFSCLKEREKSIITRKFNKPISEFPKPFVNYPSFLQEFELFPIQQFMREFLRENINTQFPNKKVKIINSLIQIFNPLMMKLFINKQSNFKYVNIYLDDCLSHARNQMDVCSLDDEIIGHVFLNVNRFYFGFKCDILNLDYYSFIQDNTTKLARCIKDVQHLSISIKLQFLKRVNDDRYDRIVEKLKFLVLSLNNLKSFSSACFWKHNEYLDMFQKHSNSLTYLKLIDISLYSTIFDILDQCPNLKTLELFSLSTHFSHSVSNHKPITSRLNHLENLIITIPAFNNIFKIFERISLILNNDLKTLFLNKSYAVTNVEWQNYFTSLEPFLSNLSHFFFKRTNDKETKNLILLMKTLKNLYHFKLGNQSNHLNRKPFSTFEIKELSSSISPSLKILEFDFQLKEEFLKGLLLYGQYNLTELSIYSTIKPGSLKIIMEYAKQRNSLTILRYKKQAFKNNNLLERAKKLFMIDDNPEIFETPFINPIF